MNIKLTKSLGAVTGDKAVKFEEPISIVVPSTSRAMPTDTSWPINAAFGYRCKVTAADTLLSAATIVPGSSLDAKI